MCPVSPVKPQMPSDQSTWLISVPQGHDPQGLHQKTVNKLTTQAKLPLRNVGQLAIPSFKVELLGNLVQLGVILMQPIDWNLGLAYWLVGRSPKARQFLYCHSGEERGHTSQSLEQRSDQIKPTHSGRRGQCGQLPFERVELERRSL